MLQEDALTQSGHWHTTQPDIHTTCMMLLPDDPILPKTLVTASRHCREQMNPGRKVVTRTHVFPAHYRFPAQEITRGEWGKRRNPSKRQAKSRNRQDWKQGEDGSRNAPWD